MKVYPDKLELHLKGTLSPVYLIHGDEPLQQMELGDQLRQSARQQGFEERQVIVAMDDSDWSAFRESTDSLSLFAPRRLIELRLPTGKPGRTGADVLKAYCQSPPEDVLLLISSARLDRSASNSAWFKALDKVGVTIAVWPVAVEHLGRWIADRLARHGLSATPEALDLLVERVEGNLLAAQQEVDRLSLLCSARELGQQQVLDAVADSARYSIADLSQAALVGQPARALHILAGLRDEAVAEVLILWTLTQEIRAGARTAEAMAVGVGMDKALKSAGVWQNRAGPLKMAIARHSAQSWLSMLAACTQLDRLIKGQGQDSVPDAFETLVAQLAGSGEPLIAKSSTLPV